MEELIKFTHLAEVLTEYAEDVVGWYRYNLKQSDRIASGKLLNSIEYITEFKGNQYLVYLNLEDYWKYVEYDTRPHFPPVDKILKWIKVKPVLPRPYYKKWKWTTKDGVEHTNGKWVLPRPEEMAWMVAKKIEREGTTGSHDLATTLEEINRQYETSIMYALEQDVQFWLNAEISFLVLPRE